MELDPRLQELAPDLHGYQFNPTADFDNGYSTAIYHGLTEEHRIPSHAQAQYVQDVAGGYYSVSTEPRQAQPPSQTERANIQHTGQTQPHERQTRHGDPNRSLSVNTSNLVRNGTANRQNGYTIHAPQQSQQHKPQAQYVNQYTSQSPIQQSPSFPGHSAAGIPTSTSITNPTFLPQPSNTTTAPSTQVQTQPSPAPAPTATNRDLTAFTPPSAFPFVPNPPDLPTWRQKFFDITSPILLTSTQYHTYFPHVDNIYSHRSTQKYKRKPFVSHYWDCRLKGRPTGTPLSKTKVDKSIDKNAEPDTADLEADIDTNRGEKKKRKRKTRERDLCDVKIKVTEFFARNELEASARSAGAGEDEDGTTNSQLTFVHEDGTTTTRETVNPSDPNSVFGVLEPPSQFPEGHPGAEGKRWYMVQRVNGTGKDGEDTEEQNLDHKHTLEESDRIKKNSVQRWLLAQEKEKKKQTPRSKNNVTTSESNETIPRRTSVSTTSYSASGEAKQTAKAHAAPAPTQLTLYSSSFCPFAQRIWIALEQKGIPYQYVEILPSHFKDGKCTIAGLAEHCPEGVVPCIVHGNFAVWESNVMMEYLEDLAIGHSLLPLGNPQLRAHCRLWADHIERKILPLFYSLLLLPIADGTLISSLDTDVTVTFVEQRAILITALQETITALVNASHATGPFFLGTEMSFVDVGFAPWIIRLSRVLSHYCEFPRPEVGTRWSSWVDAVEQNEFVKRTVSDERSYHNVYGGIGGEDDYNRNATNCSRRIAEMAYAQKVIRQEGFGLGGDSFGHLRVDGPQSQGHS